ncbi:hypothetical protein JD844_015330 [Phrynosoma platyrhinos]|uniref:Uncharacterized protein n=1 Tax=Phrynosoma platyrhinos TaxID=52577 RepID=A0ABQ7SJ04_PHRPL|nr:hypothetical protein JD844_015330 [Phrynosoma platyrhinos]
MGILAELPWVAHRCSLPCPELEQKGREPPVDSWTLCLVPYWQALATDTRVQSEKLADLEAVAARVKDFSQKQDCSVIQSLVLSAKERLARVLQQVSERGGLLEEARQRARQFSESWQLLLDWLDEVDMAPGLPCDAAVGQERIKALLGEHKVSGLPQSCREGMQSGRPLVGDPLKGPQSSWGTESTGHSPSEAPAGCQQGTVMDCPSSLSLLAGNTN